jgi:hypothetical protein
VPGSDAAIGHVIVLLQVNCLIYFPSDIF